MTQHPDEFLHALRRVTRGERRRDDPTVLEPEALHLLIPDEGGFYSQQILDIEASRAHNGVLQACRLRIALSVGDECRAVVALEASGRVEERVVRVEVRPGHLMVGTTILAWYSGAAFQARIEEFFRRQAWIEVVPLERAEPKRPAGR